MRICVISDSHNNPEKVSRVLENTSYSKIFFLGDGTRDFDEIDDNRVTLIEGNCDYFTVYPLLTTVCVEGKRIMLCHGHLFNVRSGIFSLMKEAINQKADIVCYGHTHIQNIEKSGEIYFVNPGALSLGKALEIEITKNGEVKFYPIYID